MPPSIQKSLRVLKVLITGEYHTEIIDHNITAQNLERINDDFEETLIS